LRTERDSSRFDRKRPERSSFRNSTGVSTSRLIATGCISGGIGLTAINNATYTTGTLTASCTPILGVYNPSTSLVNLVILQAILDLAMTAATNTGGAPFVWASSNR
jgi:hypothetical protein